MSVYKYISIIYSDIHSHLAAHIMNTSLLILQCMNTHTHTYRGQRSYLKDHGFCPVLPSREPLSLFPPIIFATLFLSLPKRIICRVCPDNLKKVLFYTHCFWHEQLSEPQSGLSSCGSTALVCRCVHDRRALTLSSSWRINLHPVSCLPISDQCVCVCECV